MGGMVDGAVDGGVLGGTHPADRVGSAADDLIAGARQARHRHPRGALQRRRERRRGVPGPPRPTGRRLRRIGETPRRDQRSKTRRIDASERDGITDMNTSKKAFSAIVIIAALVVAGLTIPAGAVVNATGTPGIMGDMGDHTGMGDMGDQGAMGSMGNHGARGSMDAMGDHPGVMGDPGEACGSTGTGSSPSP